VQCRQAGLKVVTKDGRRHLLDIFITFSRFSKLNPTAGQRYSVEKGPAMIDNCCIDSALSGSGGSLPHDILRVPCPRGCRNLGTVGSDAQTAGQSETNYIIASMSPVFPSHSLFPLLPSFLFSHPNHGQLAESRYNRPRAQCVGSFRSLLSLFP